MFNDRLNLIMYKNQSGKKIFEKSTKSCKSIIYDKSSLGNFIYSYKSLFQVARHNRTETALQYIQGLLSLEKGKANMVDVGHKPNQVRVAKAEGKIKLNPETVKLIRENQMKKGDVLGIAELAAVQGAKKTSELIPLCHPLGLTSIKVNAVLTDDGVRIEGEVKSVGPTGVEMEALTAVQIGLLTIYDIYKS